MLPAYPLNPLWLGLVLLVYSAILYWRPNAWLFLLPTLLPMANLSPWSGSIFIEDLDFFVLATIAVGYWQIFPERRQTRLSPLSAVLMAILALSYVVSATRGLLPLAPIDANAFSNYMSHYNSLRILKPFVWALLLLPLLRRSLNPENLTRFFIPGLLTGLAIVSCVALWERNTFTGLLDFASDYRITASFPEMHVGGAALDAYLALTVPFAMAWVLREKRPARFMLAAGLLGMAIYATLTTFSRGLYLGIAVSAAVLVFPLLQMPRARVATRPYAMAGMLITMSALLSVVFEPGGYRGLITATALCWGALFIGDIKNRPTQKWLTAGAIALFSGIAMALILLHPKGAYMAFGLSFLVFGSGVLLIDLQKQRGGLILAYAGYFGMIWSSPVVGWHWGGPRALAAETIVSAFAVALTMANQRIARPVWSWNRSNGVVFGVVLALVALATPVLGNTYMNNRLQHSGADLDYRSGHWLDVIDMMDQDAQTEIFGMGLGRLPETYFWKNKKQDLPGAYRIETEKDLSFLRLERPIYSAGAGESLRYGQRIEIQPFRNYELGLDARTKVQGALLHAEICRKYLIYFVGACVVSDIALDADGAWHHYDVAMPSGTFGREVWYERPTFQFSISNERGNGYFDVTHVHLAAEGSKNLLKNSGFDDGSTRWFFTSDHYHLPWHAKNMFLNIYFDQGFFGLIIFLLILGASLSRMTRKMMQGDAQSGMFLASLSGFVMVGLFDSILDFPRLSLLFYLMIMMTLLRPQTIKKQTRSIT
jgi:hypothetical protein